MEIWKVRLVFNQTHKCQWKSKYGLGIVNQRQQWNPYLQMNPACKILDVYSNILQPVGEMNKRLAIQ